MNLLLESSIRALLMAVMVAAVIAGLKIANARARHIAWLGVLVAMLLLPAFVKWGPKTTVPLLPPAMEAPWPQIEPWIPASPPDEAKPLRSRAAPTQQPPPPSRPVLSPLDLMLAAYLLGGLLLLIRLILGSIRASALLRKATREQGFLSSPECACPVTVGWLHPSVVLPSSWREWPQAELDAVLAHEREHARRRDPLVRWIAAFNRCIFWFHPLAWWLEHKLAALAEEACDDAVIARGCDPGDYSEFLIRQARAVQHAGSRTRLQGAAMGEGALAGRIRRLLETPQPIPNLSRTRSTLATALCTLGIGAFAACHLDRIEKPAPGQPTMNELMHRQADQTIRQQQKQNAIVARARALRPEEVQPLIRKFEANPDEEEESYWVLDKYYEFKQDVNGRDALYLWVIEHHPDGKIWPGNINPQWDRAGYERGKSLWLTYLKRPGASVETYQKAAAFLEAGDRPMAESVLEAARKAYPNIPRGWTSAFAQHYAQALIGSREPLTNLNVFRNVEAEASSSEYAQQVRTRLSNSTDPELLIVTARWLVVWGQRAPGPMQLARTYTDRALSLAPDSEAVKAASLWITDLERIGKAQQFTRLSPAEVSALSDSDRILRILYSIFITWTRNPDDAIAQARELLDLTARNTKDPLYGDAVYEANVILGKAALRHGDRKTAVRHLLAAADAPVSGHLPHNEFELNLPRALIDAGERSAVADFFDRMAPKMERTAQFKSWAADIRKGINPDSIPAFSYPGCSHDPC